MKLHVQRMINELEELQQRKDKLSKFITDNSIMQVVPTEQLELMKKQLTHMIGYEETLTARLDLELRNNGRH